jgi:hypothetical protein
MAVVSMNQEENRMNYPKVFRISKTIVRKVNRKSLTLTDGKAVRIKRVVDDHAFWIVVR